MTYNITLTANHQSLTAKYLPLAAESVQYLTAKVVYETDDWTGREIKAMFERGCTVYEVPVTGGEITAKQQLNLTAGDWRVWLVGNSARDGDVIPRITTNVAHIRVAPTGGTEGNPFPTTPPTVEERLRADMGNLADLTTEDKSSLVAAINEVRQTGGGGVQPDWNQNDETQPDYVKNRPFYTGNPVETVLVEESTVTFSFSEKSGVYMGELKSTFSATVGETYKVSWDGAAYECACVDFFGETVIGNLSIAGEGSDTGEPFIMVVYNGRGIAIGTADTSASHTFSICVFAPEVVKIDPKYIRDMYYTGDPVETVMLPETTITIEAKRENLISRSFPYSFELGKTYVITFDGVDTEYTAYEAEGRVCVGYDYSSAAGGSGYIIMASNGAIILVTLDTSLNGSHTIAIKGYTQEIIKIDEKYLPDNVATKADVEAVQTTAYNAQTTANNAKTTASNAQTKASNAQTTANNARTTANNAKTTADDAKTTADDAKTTANNAKTTANNAQTTANNAKSEALDLAARMFGHTSVVDNAFYRDETLSITSLPACIESIGAYAFTDCTNLALTSLPSGLTSIGDHAFARCTNLALTSLPSGLTSIGNGAFIDCTNLALTSLPSGIKSIGDHAFLRCTNLALTSLPSGLTSIGDGAFIDCTNLALTSLPSGIKSIGVYALKNCTGLTSITFTGKPTTISSAAFAGCTNLTTINVPWAEGEVANAPWGATNATMNYNYTEA